MTFPADSAALAEPSQTLAADAAVWSLLALLFFCISCFLAAALVIKKRAKKPSVMEGLEDELKPHFDSPKEPERAPWERPADWWKQ